MGAPPAAAVTEPARANPIGVSYFYGAQEERTSVSEMRPYRGLLLSVGRGETVRDLRLLDLTAGMGIDSPFGCPDGYLRSRMESCELFNHLNEEFAKPLRHGDETNEYKPTQFFAQWVRDHHFDGLRYGSAMCEGGRNVVFFDTAVVKMTSVRLVRTDAVEVTYSDYSSDDE